jgi:hypothetical protein
MVKKYIVFSKSKTGKEWLIERSYMSKSYAEDVAKNIRENGRLSKIRKV